MKVMLAMAAGLFASASYAADITVLASPAIKEAYAELAARFPGGHKVATTWDGTTAIMKRMKSGEVFDVVIVASDSLDELVDTGRIMAGSRSDIARSGVGVMVRAGAARPDISSGEAVKRALLAAKSVAISTGPSGVHMRSLFQRLGVAEEVTPKLHVPPSGAQIADLVAKGEAELGFQQISEIVNSKGADYVGPLPADIQRITLFAGGVHTGAGEPDAARAFLRFLAQPEHAPVLQKHGLQLGSPAPY